MLILEGPDLVGKTTLAKCLLAKFTSNPRGYGAYPVIGQHFSRLPECWHHLKSYLPYITRYCIMDRFHLSELTYGPVTRGKSGIIPAYLHVLEGALALVGSYTVLVTATPQFLEQQWKTLVEGTARAEMFNLDQILAVNAKYESLAQDWPGAHIDEHWRITVPEDLLSRNEESMHSMLYSWSLRLSAIQGFTNGGSYYESANREVEAISGFRG